MADQPSQLDVMAALQTQGNFRAANPPSTQSYSELAAEAPGSLTSPAEGSAGPKNSRKLYCPRESCGSVIIGPGHAELVAAEAAMLPAEEGSPFDAASTSTHYFKVTGGPYAFDNIGFSRAIDTPLPASAPGADSPKAKAEGKVKWLICAECDLGPLGWSFNGGQDAWLAADRLRYSAQAKEAKA